MRGEGVKIPGGIDHKKNLEGGGGQWKTMSSLGGQILNGIAQCK